MPRELFRQFAQAAEAVGSQLTEDAGEHLRQLLGLSMARDGESVGGQRGLNFGVVEMNHSPVVLDHVDLRRGDRSDDLLITVKCSGATNDLRGYSK